MKIAVLMGGTSSERNVSLASGIRVVLALRERGHTVTALDPARGVITASEERELSKKKVGTEAPSLEALSTTMSSHGIASLSLCDRRRPSVAGNFADEL